MLNRVFIVPYSAVATSAAQDSIQSAINTLVQKALDTGDWSALATYNPTRAQLNLALSKSTYKNTKKLNEAQIQQFAQAALGNWNKYVSNTDATISEEDRKAGGENDPTAEAAKQLGATANMNEQLSAIKAQLNGYGNLADTYNAPDYTNVDDASVRSIQQLQQDLGTNVNYDYDAIKSIYDRATIAANEIEQQSGAERSYYQHLADAQNTALDTIRQQYGSAIANGATRGMQAAQQLSAVLGMAGTANEEATQLAIDKQTRANQYASQMAQNAKDALQYSNSEQLELANLSRTLYNDAIQKQTAQLSYNQGINTDNANYNAARATALGSLQSSLANTIAGVYNNNQSAIATLQSAIANANANKYAADRQKTTASAGVKTTT